MRAVHFKNVVNHFVDEAGGTGVREFVINFFAGASIDNEAGLAQNAQMVGNGGSTHADGNRDVQDTGFAVSQQPQNAQTRRVAELLKNVGGFVKSFFVRHVFQELFQISAMVVKLFAGGMDVRFVFRYSAFFRVKKIIKKLNSKI